MDSTPGTSSRPALEAGGIEIPKSQHSDNHRLSTASSLLPPRAQVITNRNNNDYARPATAGSSSRVELDVIRPFQQLRNHPPRAPSSSSKSPILDPLRSGVPYLHSTTNSYPIPTRDYDYTSGVDRGTTRRRLSNPATSGPSSVRAKKQSLDQTRSPTSPRREVASTTGTSSAWLTGSLVTTTAAEEKLNKSDDEREVDDKDVRRRPTHRKKRHRWGMDDDRDGEGSSRTSSLVSMIPPSTETRNPYVEPPLPMPSTSRSPSRTGYSLTLTPLPQDSNNILPLSLPASPFPSPPVSLYSTPYHTPHPSIPDLSAAYTADFADPSGSSESARTSSSTSTRYGWSGAGRSDSRSSADDDDLPSSGPSRPWWWAQNHAPLSPHVAPPMSSSRLIRLGSSAKLLPTGTRSWGWLLGYISRTFRARSPDLTHRVRPRDREKDRLMPGYANRKVQMESKWTRRSMAIVPTAPWSISIFLVLFAMFAVTVTFTLKHILNPDKEALPWRSYCMTNYPSLYSLQDPNARIPPTSAVGSTITFTSPPANDPLPLNSFFPFASSSLALAPLTTQHPAWPYHPHATQPFVANTSTGLDELEPVGILVGVFTTDAGAERRHMIRQSYATHWRSRREGTEGVTVRFVMGRPRRRFAQAVQLEMEAFNDIILLDMPENMNAGKTHAFFSWAAENATVPHWEYPAFRRSVEGSTPNERSKAPVWRGEKPPAYVVKADEDSFIMLGELERRLRVAPRTKAYWGYLVKNQFMAGECYGLSFDLVQYIAASPALRTMTRGKEDKLVSRWMRMHPDREEIVWVAERCWIYDHPKAGTVYSHGFLFPSTVAEIRKENATGLPESVVTARGGQLSADAYSSVSKFGTTYRPPSSHFTATEQVEALIEGSRLSLLGSNTTDLIPGLEGRQAYSEPSSDPRMYSRFATRPTRTERFLGDPEERGGTVVVHYIKKADWFVETMIAFLGTAEEQAVWHRGDESGGRQITEGQLVGAAADGGVKLGKDGGL